MFVRSQRLNIVVGLLVHQEAKSVVEILIFISHKKFDICLTGLSLKSGIRVFVQNERE